MRLVIALLLVMMVTPCFASDRVDELGKEAQELIQRRAEYTQVLNNINVRLIQIEAIMGELNGDNNSPVNTANNGDILDK